MLIDGSSPSHGSYNSEGNWQEYPLGSTVDFYGAGDLNYRGQPQKVATIVTENGVARLQSLLDADYNGQTQGYLTWNPDGSISNAIGYASELDLNNYALNWDGGGLGPGFSLANDDSGGDGGASRAQLSDYAQDGIKSIQTYKRMLIIENRGAYSDYMAVKHVLLDNPTLSKTAPKLLSKNPEIISDFDRLLKEVSQESLSPKLTEEKILSLKSELQTQKNISYETHKKAFNEIKEKLTFKNASG